MGNIRCTKCGLEAFGKCPKCRTVFPEKEEYRQTEAEQSCEHDWHYTQPDLRCIYGCGYISPKRKEVIRMETTEQQVGTDTQVPKEIAEAIEGKVPSEEVKLETKAPEKVEAKTEAKAPEKAKPPKKAAKKTAKKANGGKKLAGGKAEAIADFVRGVRGAKAPKAKAGQPKARSDASKRSYALKRLLGAMATRGWKAGKGGEFTLAGHKVLTETKGHFVMVEPGKHHVSLGQGAIIEVDDIVAG